ncbi:MAG: tetratricopeptide repeat protein [Bacteroidetes bacterium]|nr:tetratricopeptide repeat protein [Bacteroidota bacterium]
MPRYFLWLIYMMAAAIIPCRAQIVEQPYQYGSRAVIRAEAQFNHGLLTLSQRLATDALTRFPETPAADRAILLRAAADRAAGNFILADAGLQYFTAIRPNSPLCAVARFERGLLAYERQNFKESVLRFQEAEETAEAEFSTRRDSTFYRLGSDAAFWCAVSVAKLGIIDEAIPRFENLARTYPNARFADDALFAAGELHDAAHRPDEAIPFYRIIREKYTHRNTIVAALTREAADQIIMRNYQNATGLLEQADAMRAAVSNDSVGMFYEAQDYAENVRENIGYLRGEAFSGIGQYERAVTAYAETSRLFPQSYLGMQIKLGRGWALLNLGRYQEAEQFYRQVIDSAAEDADARATAMLYHAVTQKYMGNREQAGKEFAAMALQTGFPYTAQALLEVGQVHYEDGHYDQARKSLERAERESPDAVTSARILILLGLSYLETEQYDKSIKSFSAVEKLANSANNVVMPLKLRYLAESRLYQGIALAKNNRYREAVAKLGTFLAEHSSDARCDEAVFWIGESSYRAELFKNAQDFYEEVLERYPKSKRAEEALYGLGWTLFRQSEFTKSAAKFAELTRRYPETRFAADAMARKGDGHFILKQYREAAEAYRRATKYAPKTEESQYSAYQLGYALFRAGDLETAAEAFRSFVRTYPRSRFAPAALYSLGWTYFQQRNYSDAITAFNNLTQTYPGHELIARARYSVGDCHYNLGDFEQAASEYRIVATSYPSSLYAGEAIKSLQFCLEALGREAEADSVVEEYTRNNPTLEVTKDLITSKAQKFYSSGRYANAAAELESFLSKYPDDDKNAEALFYLGKSYIGMNEPLKAERALNDAKNKYPNSEYAPLGQLEIAYLKLQQNLPSGADSVFNIVQNDYAASPQAPQAGFERADIAYKRGDTVKSLNIYRDVAARYRATEYGDQSLYRVAMFYRMKNIFDTSRLYFTELAGRTSNPLIAAESNYRIGELWAREKNCDSATAAFGAVREKYSEVEDWFTLSTLGAGECYERLANIEAARAAYQTIATLRPDDDYGKTAVARLKRLSKETGRKP